MTLVTGGKENAFEELYLRYAKRMLSFFYRKLNQDEQKSQDFLQDLFLKIAEKPHFFDTEKKFIVWIYTVAYNMCKNEYRRNSIRGRQANADDFIDVPDASAINIPEKLDQDLFINSLNREVEKLDEKHQTTFILRYNDNLTIREISQILACSEGTVKSRLFYALKKLAAKLPFFDPHGETK